MLRATERLGRRARAVPGPRELARARRREAGGRGRARARLRRMSLPPLVDADWVQEHLGEPDLVLGDVRGPNAHSAGTCRGRSRSCSARRRRWPTARSCRSSRSRCSGASAGTGSPARSASSSTTAATASAPPPPPRPLCWPVTRTSRCSRAVSRRWPGELEHGRDRARRRRKTELEPRLDAVPTWEELRDRLDDPRADDPRRPLSDDEYSGRGGYPCDPRQGHIPGARQLEVERLFAGPGRPHEPWAVRELVGLPEGSEIVAYCHSGLALGARRAGAPRRRVRRAQLPGLVARVVAPRGPAGRALSGASARKAPLDSQNG